jgi:hypothetical protein
VAERTCRRHLSGIRFFAERTRQRPWPVFERMRPWHRHQLPVVRSPQAVRSLGALVDTPTARRCLRLIAAWGLRWREGPPRQVSDLNAPRRLVWVRQGQWGKNRCVLLASRGLAWWRESWPRQRPRPLSSHPHVHGLVPAGGAPRRQGPGRWMVEPSPAGPPAPASTLADRARPRPPPASPTPESQSRDSWGPPLRAGHPCPSCTQGLLGVSRALPRSNEGHHEGPSFRTAASLRSHHGLVARVPQPTVECRRSLLWVCVCANIVHLAISTKC